MSAVNTDRAVEALLRVAQLVGVELLAVGLSR